MGKLGLATTQTVSPDSREAILGALLGVPGLITYPTVPETPSEGASWPVWVQTTFDGVLALPGRPTYDVYVLLPAGHPTETVEKGDGLLGQVATALWPIGAITLAEPVSVRFENQTTMPGLRLRLVMRGNK
jgi:hypothetical protein